MYMVVEEEVMVVETVPEQILYKETGVVDLQDLLNVCQLEEV